MGEPIRVLNLFTIMDRAGAETMAMNYYRHIDRSKVQFDFMVHREHRGEYDDEIEAMGGRIYRMLPIYPQNFGKYKKQLRAFFDEHDEYKILHSNMSELGYYAFKEAAKHGQKTLICHAHNAPHGIDMKSAMRYYFKARIKKYTTDMFICGQSSGDWLFGKENRDKFVMMNNAIDTDRFIYSEETRVRKRKEFKIDDDTIVLGHVGRLTKQKNHGFLFDVFAEVLKREPNAVLFLIGKGELEDELKIYAKDLGIADKVIFAGIREDMNELYQMMDLFVFPSLFEGLPVTMIEAQASGLPCIISDTISEQTIITDVVERLSLEQSPKQWAQEVLKHRLDKRRNMKEYIARVNFDIKANAKWLEEYYINAYRNKE